MQSKALAAAVVAVLAGCAASTPKAPEPIPPHLILDGYTAAECRITEPGGAVTETGPDGRPLTVGNRSPKVECAHHTQGPLTVTNTPTCHTQKGKELPLSDCCMNAYGSAIPNCEKKLQPPGE